MEEKFDSNVLRLEKQINNITQHINKFKNKNHKTMKNIMEKIKYFSNEMNNNNEIINMTKKTLDETGKKSLIKTYQSLSNSNIPSTMSNKVYQYQNKYRYKNPIILKENNGLGNYNYNYSNKRNNNTFVLYSNKEFYNNKKMDMLSNINYNSAPKISNINMYDDINYYNKYDNNNNNTSKSNMNKCISFNYDYFSKNDYNDINENDIQRRNYSYNNFRTNNFIRNDLTNRCSNDDLKYDKEIKNELSIDNFDKYNKYDKLDKDLGIKSTKKLANKKLNIQYITTNNNISKDNNISNIIIKDKNYNENIINKDNESKTYRNKSANNIKEVKNIKREHCNINISEYYKNINSKETKKKKNTKISNNKRFKNVKSKMNKTDKKNISNGNNHTNTTSRNHKYYSSYSNSNNTRADTNMYKNNNSNYTNAVCSTFNPYYNDRFYENEKSSSTQKDLRKSSTNFRENLPNNNMNNLNFQYEFQNQNQNQTEKNNDYYTFNYNYKYFGFNSSKNNSNYDISNDYNNISRISLNKKNIKLNSNNNYNKDFLDIITNKNNDISKYDHLSIYNNIINQKKENTKIDDYIPVKEEKYDIIFSKLKCNNTAECSNKIDILLNYEDFFNKINLLYNKNSFNKKKDKNNKNLNDIYSWVESTVEKNKKLVQELKKYQNCQGKSKNTFEGLDKLNKFSNNKKSNYEYETNEKLIEDKNWIKETIKTRNNENNGNNVNKENSDLNSYFQNIDDYRLKTRTHSYSNLSIDDLKNENGYYNNTYSMSEKKSKNFIKYIGINN